MGQVPLTIISIIIVSASNEGLDGVFHMPQLLDKMILIDGHRDGFMKWLSLFEPQNK